MHAADEVISDRAIQRLGGALRDTSSNASFPAAMHIVAVRELDDHLMPQPDPPPGSA